MDFKIVLMEYEGDGEKNVVIPEGVTHIGSKDYVSSPSNFPIRKPVFWNCKNIESITIPKSVTYIEERAFVGCSSLKSIVILGGIEFINEGTFINCESLESVTLPESLKIIEDNAFRYCKNLKSINIPKNVEKIGYNAFTECTSLESIEVPENVIIEHNAFSGCKSLKSVPKGLSIDADPCDVPDPFVTPFIAGLGAPVGDGYYPFGNPFGDDLKR